VSSTRPIHLIERVTHICVRGRRLSGKSLYDQSTVATNNPAFVGGRAANAIAEFLLDELFVTRICHGTDDKPATLAVKRYQLTPTRVVDARLALPFPSAATRGAIDVLS